VAQQANWYRIYSTQGKIRIIEMETVKGNSELELALLSSEELKWSYHKINTRLARNLLGGASLRDQAEDIKMLNTISTELNRRKAFSGAAPTPGGAMSS
jgi:hypothetical protein